MDPARSVRLPWIDHVRTLVIVLVVHLHACVTYSHVGDWYVKSAREPTLAEKVPFIVWEGHLQAFFMGLLFFISGFFAHGSLSRRGALGFARERLVRLGLPVLFYMLVIHPFIVLGLNPWNAQFGSRPMWFARYVITGRFLASSGPLWFAFALLIFCLILACWHAIRKRAHPDISTPSSTEATIAAPSAKQLWFFALALGLGSFLVRLVQPMGTSILNLQLCFFVQYVAFFVAGLHAARHGWLLPLVVSVRARAAGWLALIGGPAVLLSLMFAGRTGSPSDFFGGWHWQAFGYAVWEQLVGVGLSLGVLAFFARRLNVEHAPLRWLSERSFGVFVFHAPVLVALMMLFRPLPQQVYLLIAALTLAGLVASFVVADVARRVPGLRAIV
jgi:glucan biosynthesis protein C